MGRGRGWSQWQWARPVLRDEGVGSVGGAFRYGVFQDRSDRIQYFVLIVSYFLSDSSKSTSSEVSIQGPRNRQPAYNAEVFAADSLAPCLDKITGSPAGEPRADHGVGGGAVSRDTMQTEIVTAVAVWAVRLARGIIPEGGIVGIPHAGLQAERPLVPSQAPESQWPPREWVEGVVGVTGNGIVRPHFMGGVAGAHRAGLHPRGAIDARGQGRGGLCRFWHTYQLPHCGYHLCGLQPTR